MPIKDLQQRLRQIGEIRIGHTVATGKTDKNGKPVKRPAKLSKFRFTSPSKVILDKVAEKYGGTVQPWTPANGGTPEWEVYSTFDRLPILVPPRDAVSQWYELYAGSRCLRRCDGEVEQKSDKPCMCNPENRQCSITTRVNVMLRDVPALGQWLLVSKGYNSAVTLPGAAEILALVGGYVPGWLGMEEKVVLKDDGPPNRFMVPTIDVDVTPGELMAGQVTGAAPKVELASPGVVAIEAAKAAAATPPKDFLAAANAAADAAAVRKIYDEAQAAGAPKDYLAQLAAVGKSKPGAKVAPVADAVPESDGKPVEFEDDVVEAELVDDEPSGDPTDLWVQIVTAASRFGWSMQQIEDEFAAANGGTMPGSAEASELRGFLEQLRSRV